MLSNQIPNKRLLRLGLEHLHKNVDPFGKISVARCSPLNLEKHSSEYLASSRTPLRTMRGSNMVEGVVGLMLVIGGLVFAALFLLNCGVAVYNQEKIGFVAHSAVAIAAQDASGSRQANVTAAVNTLMSTVGLNSANTTATITDITINSMPAVSLKITANLPTLLSSSFGGILPQQLQINETAVALKPYNPMNYLLVSPPLGPGCVVPMLQPNGNYPNDGLPVWLVSLAGIRQIRN